MKPDSSHVVPGICCAVLILMTQPASGVSPRHPAETLPKKENRIWRGDSIKREADGRPKALADAGQALEPVVVTGTREMQSLENSAADVVLIDREALEESGAASVEDALRQFAGLQLSRNGGPGQSGGYFLRGVGASGVVVLVDGMRVGSATLGQVEFSGMSLSQIDRIEVLRGAASGLYGADAVGGVINIITQRGMGKPRVRAGVAVGNYGAREADAGLSGDDGLIDYAVSVGHERNEGVSAIRPGDSAGYYNPDRDGFRRTVGSLNLGLAPAKGHRVGLIASQSKLNSRYDSAIFDPVTYAADASPDFRNRLETRQVALDYRGVLNERWTTSLQVGSGTDELLSGAATTDHFETDRRQLTWQNRIVLMAGQQLVLAHEYLREDVESSSYTRSQRRTNRALIAGYVGSFGATGVEASVRRDDNSAYGATTTGSLAVRHEVTPNLAVRAQAGKSFRAPTFNDLYYPNYGVSSLRPENGRNIELGAHWQAGQRDEGWGRNSVGMTVYRNRVRDLIGYNPDSTGTSCPAGYFGCAGNTSQATLRGVTLDAAHHRGAWKLRAQVDFLHARDEQTGARLARRAAHQGSLMADYAQDRWGAGGTLVEVGSRPDGTKRLGGYSTLDLRAHWRPASHWQLEVRVLNALDRDIEPVRDYQALGRQVWMGMRVDTAGL